MCFMQDYSAFEESFVFVRIVNITGIAKLSQDDYAASTDLYLISVGICDQHFRRRRDSVEPFLEEIVDEDACDASTFEPVLGRACVRSHLREIHFEMVEIDCCSAKQHVENDVALHAETLSEIKAVLTKEKRSATLFEKLAARNRLARFVFIVNFTTRISEENAAFEFAFRFNLAKHHNRETFFDYVSLA